MIKPEQHALQNQLKLLLNDVFDACDTNKDSKLNLYQLGNLLMAIGKAVTKIPVQEEKVDSIMGMIDYNRDGYIDQTEFQMLKQLLVEELVFQIKSRPFEIDRIVFSIHQLRNGCVLH